MDGKLSRVAPYTKGKENGIEKNYYEDGILLRVIPYKNGNIHGIEKTYYQNGNIKSEFPYVYGNVNGVARTYYESGKLKSEITYKNTEAISTKNYDENGRPHCLCGAPIPRCQGWFRGAHCKRAVGQNAVHRPPGSAYAQRPGLAHVPPVSTRSLRQSGRTGALVPEGQCARDLRLSAWRYCSIPGDVTPVPEGGTLGCIYDANGQTTGPGGKDAVLGVFCRRWGVPLI